MGEELKRVVAYKLLSADRDTVIDGLMEMVFAVGDVTWVSERLCEQADSADTGVSSLAITCFGHLARLHQRVGDTSCIFQLLRDKHRSPVPDIRGAAEDAMDDISVFMGIDLRKK